MPRGGYFMELWQGPEIANFGADERNDPTGGISTRWQGMFYTNVANIQYTFQFTLDSFMNARPDSGVYITALGQVFPIHLYNCASFNMATSNVTYVDNVPTFTNVIAFNDIPIETYGQGASSVSLVFTQHFNADWTQLTVKTDVFADLTNLKLYFSNGTEVPPDTDFSLNFEYMVCLINQTASQQTTAFVLPSEVTPSEVYFSVNGTGDLQYSLADMTLSDVYAELQGNNQVTGKTSTANFNSGWQVGCVLLQTFNNLTYGLTTGIQSDPTIQVNHTRVPTYWGKTSQIIGTIAVAVTVIISITIIAFLLTKKRWKKQEIQNQENARKSIN